MLSKKEIAKKIGVSLITIDRLRQKGLPCYKVGNRVLFDEEEVMNWVRGFKE